MKTEQVATAPDHALAYGPAFNVAPIAEAPEEWTQICPFGEFPNDKGTQVITPESSRRVVTAFDERLMSLGTSFRGIPVFRGHPDARPDLWSDDRRYGRYNALEVRADGLYGKPAWNSLGHENLREGFYVYPSPAWHFQSIGNGRISPTNLVSVGLTNTPNIREVAPLTNSLHPGMTAWANASGAPAPDSIEAAYSLLTPEGRARRFKERTDELMGKGMTLDQAVFEMRTGDNEDDHKLLEAMGEKPTHARREALHNQKQLDNLKRIAEENARAAKGSAEVAAALAKNSRRVAFNARLDELIGRGFSINQAIYQMLANPRDAALLAEMDAA